MVRVVRMINTLAAFVMVLGVTALAGLALWFFTREWFLPAFFAFMFFVFTPVTLILKERARRRRSAPSDTGVALTVVNILHHRFTDDPGETSEAAKRVQQAVNNSEPVRVRRCKDCGLHQLEYDFRDEPVIVLLDPPDRALRWGWALGLQLLGVRVNRRTAT